VLITKDYIHELKKIHKKDEDWGTGPRGNIIRICNFLYANNVKRLLDYGCGKGENLGWFLPIVVTNYDPAIPEWSRCPKAEDYLLCTDVLEHVEPAYIENVIEHLVSKFNKKAFLSIPLKKSKKLLSDGRNAHLIVKPAFWWIELLQRFCFVEHLEFAQDSDEQDDILITLKK
jgi:hypothetical protein